MRFQIVHDSGSGRDRVRVESYGNGIGYTVVLGEDAAPLLDVFLQGDEAAAFRDRWEAAETARPDTDTGLLIRELVEDYL